MATMTAMLRTLVMSAASCERVAGWGFSSTRDRSCIIAYAAIEKRLYLPLRGAGSIASCRTRRAGSTMPIRRGTPRMTDAPTPDQPITSLRGWLDRLAARDRLAAIAKRFEGDKAVLFPRPGGHAMPVVSGIVSNRAWIAEAMGVAPAGMIARFEEAAGHPVPCRLVGDGPVREVVHERVDLAAMLP